MLRSPEWIADYGAHVGGTVWLNMPEMGVEGEAEVLDIGPAQVYDVRPGLVTGTFRHTSGEVYDLKLDSESKPIGVTGTHPFWSVDRQAWVSVLDLEIGETLKTLEGTTVVESRVRRPSPEPVYNIEVEGDHCYRVGESGVLVHNASAKKKNPCSGFDLGEKRLDSYKDFTIPDPIAWNRRGLNEDTTYRKVDGLTVLLQIYPGQGSAPDDYFQEMIWRTEPASMLGAYPRIGVSTDSVGHIVGNQFGGSANRANGLGNVFPQDRADNNGAFSQAEDASARLITNDNKNVCVVFKFKYDTSARHFLRPTSYKYIRYVLDPCSHEVESIETLSFTQ